MQIRKADLSIGQGGVEAEETRPDRGAPSRSRKGDIELPDVLTDLQDSTQLTRKSLVRILDRERAAGRLQAQPAGSSSRSQARSINRTKRLALVDGIKYQQIGDESYYAQELFEQEELTGYLRNMLKDATKSVFEHVVYDSGGVERTFAEQLEKNEAVKIYAKLPAGSKCRRRSAPTIPIGRCWSRQTARSASTSWSRPRAACSPTISATTKARRSSAARLISRRLPLETIRQNSLGPETLMTC